MTECVSECPYSQDLPLKFATPSVDGLCVRVNQAFTCEAWLCKQQCGFCTRFVLAPFILQGKPERVQACHRREHHSL